MSALDQHMQALNQTWMQVMAKSAQQEQQGQQTTVQSEENATKENGQNNEVKDVEFEEVK